MNQQIPGFFQQQPSRSFPDPNFIDHDISADFSASAVDGGYSPSRPHHETFDSRPVHEVSGKDRGVSSTHSPSPIPGWNNERHGSYNFVAEDSPLYTPPPPSQRFHTSPPYSPSTDQQFDFSAIPPAETAEIPPPVNDTPVTDLVEPLPADVRMEQTERSPAIAPLPLPNLSREEPREPSQQHPSEFSDNALGVDFDHFYVWDEYDDVELDDLPPRVRYERLQYEPMLFPDVHPPAPRNLFPVEEQAYRDGHSAIDFIAALRGRMGAQTDSSSDWFASLVDDALNDNQARRSTLPAPRSLDEVEVSLFDLRGVYDRHADFMPGLSSTLR